MIKKLFFALIALVAIFCTIGLFLPKDYRVEKSIEISAAPQAVHRYVGDLNRWQDWGPWTEADPTMKSTVGDQATGVGASQSWSGESGNGRMVFTRSSPVTGVAYDMWFENDQWESKGGLMYAPAGSNTEVAWWMAGTADMPVIGGWFALMTTKMSEPMFDKGLKNLKRVVENQN